ncbi:flagellin [Paracoccaceae bacterium]|nr:flagellin [Paracoccaceae bacterium]
MALTLTTNNAALNAAASASSVNRDMEKSMARLSSGKRINSASDDAAGVAISSRLTAEIRGTNQAIRNALDAQALIDTAEGAHVEVENLLQRGRELLIQGASDTNSANDRANLSKEISAIFDEIERIESATSWAGQNLFDGADGTEDGYKYNDYSFQVGSATDPSNQISIRIYEIGNDTEIAGLRILSADIKTNFTTLLTAADDALSGTASSRSELGAVSNRLNHTVNNLTNISSNLSAAKGGIEDADFALETTNLAKNQILQQASTAMLAQANASKQNVLSLLQG